MSNSNKKCSLDTVAAKRAKNKKRNARKRNKCKRPQPIKENIEVVQQDSSSFSLVPEQSCSQEKDKSPIIEVPPNSSEQSSQTMPATNETVDTASIKSNRKTREDIKAEREAKKLAKQAKKMQVPAETVQAPSTSTKVAEDPVKKEMPPSDRNVEKSREQIMAEREAKKLAKQTAKAAKVGGNEQDVQIITQELKNLQTNAGKESATPAPPAQTAPEEKKKPALSKAERRAIQEAQRAAKANALNSKKTPAKPSKEAVDTVETPRPKPKVIPENEKRTSPTKSSLVTPKTAHYKVKLFNHLESAWKDVSLFVNNAQIHPSMVRLGEQYARRTVVGSNARCLAFMNALKMVIQDFETPPKKEFSRSLETSINTAVAHLHKCRPLAVSVSNAHKHIKHVLTQLPKDKPESELKEDLCHFVDCYIENQIGKAAQAISSSMQEKIKNGDVILTFGCSSLINFICEEAHSRHVDFRVIVVDSRPFCEGQELLRRLASKEIPCTYVLVNAVGFVMPEATKVLLGAHALLSNGYVMARTGTAQVALVANSFNVPVLVCCETHKFSERFQTDAIVYNELGDPHDLVLSKKCCLTNWQAKSKMSPLNLTYDITPPELVTAVVTEVSILPCTSVPVILRIKPTEIGYYS